VDTEADRYLSFEKWWGGHVFLNGPEIQYIVDNLFVGNRLATAGLVTSDGFRIDLRNVRSPIIIFCSWGDNITPPQQALGWITDLYTHESDIVANGQTIVYTTHQTIGHLGIFVSGKVATKEHAEFASCMDMIDLTPPGLYEAVITEVTPDTANPQLIQGRYLFKLEARTLDDIRAFGNNDAEDDRRFATMARLSEVNLALYRAFAQPFVQAMATDQSAQAMRDLHPSRLRFAAFSDRNPLMKGVAAAAEQVRASRKPVEPGNPLLAAEQAASTWISTWLDALRISRDGMTEAFFVNFYGAPLLQALTGMADGSAAHRGERDLARDAIVARLRAELEKLYEVGGLPAAGVRALLYIRMASGSADERGLAVLKALREMRPANERLHLAELKEIIRVQSLLLRFDEERAVNAIRRLLPDHPEERARALGVLRQVINARGTPSEEEGRRLKRIEAIFA
jgi:hypothetical protein